MQRIPFNTANDWDRHLDLRRPVPWRTASGENYIMFEADFEGAHWAVCWQSSTIARAARAGALNVTISMSRIFFFALRHTTVSFEEKVCSDPSPERHCSAESHAIDRSPHAG
jgi:hypothetical protein